MKIPARILRAHEIDHNREAYELTQAQQEREARIRAGAMRIFARFGFQNIAFRDLATALRMATATLRFHFTDLDALLADLLHAHLQAIACALGAVPRDAPDPQAARRAAYLAYTRTGWGGLTDAHLVLVRDRHLLPPDLQDSIDQVHHGFGMHLAGDRGMEALVLLDNAALDPERIEAYLAPEKPALPEQQPEQQPEQKPAQPRLPPPVQAETPIFQPAAWKPLLTRSTAFDPPPDDKPGEWVKTLCQKPSIAHHAATG
jgi:AcrR family transcriptional regulator